MEHILKTYLQVTQHFSKQFRDHFGKLNLTFPQAFTLSALAECPMRMSELAEKTGSANSTISGIMDRLEVLGLARRVRSEEDHRIIMVEVTEKYQKMRERSELGVTEYFDSLLTVLSPEEQGTVVEGLKLLNRALSDPRADRDRVSDSPSVSST